MEISITDARNLFKKYLLAKYVERPIVFGFLRSFFKTDESTSKLLSIEVMRGSEKVAVDVIRGTEGNKNKISRSTEKQFLPPYYHEWMDATDLDIYDQLFGESGNTDTAILSKFVTEMANSIGLLQDKIERAYELQCAQVLEDGIVQLNAGTNIDFKRKALSKVDKSATPWSNNAYNPYAHLIEGAKFLREVGKAQGGIVNVIMGSGALSAFLANQFVIDRGGMKNIVLDTMSAPQRNSVGASLHGEITIGDTIARVWSYPEVYENSAGSMVSYVNTKKVIMIPENPNFKLGFAAVPQLLGGVKSNKQGAYLIGEFLDERNCAHIVDIKSAGVAVPVAVDQIWTAQVLA